MREYKFRGKRKNNGEWVYGYFYNDNMIGCNIFQTKPHLVAILVDPATVGEYTGLHDKNGKEVYEGDILHCWGGEYCQGYWEFDTKFAIKNLINDCFMLGESEFIEVIGNIYDNPELLKEVE